MNNPPPNTLERAKYTRTQICIYFYMVARFARCQVQQGGGTINFHAVDQHARQNVCGMLAECLRKCLHKAVRMLLECLQKLSHAAEMLSECFGDACGMLADSALENDRRMLQGCWQTDTLLLPDELIA